MTWHVPPVVYVENLSKNGFLIGRPFVDEHDQQNYSMEAINRIHQSVPFLHSDRIYLNPDKDIFIELRMMITDELPPVASVVEQEIEVLVLLDRLFSYAVSSLQPVLQRRLRGDATAHRCWWTWHCLSYQSSLRRNSSRLQDNPTSWCRDFAAPCEEPVNSEEQLCSRACTMARHVYIFITYATAYCSSESEASSLGDRICHPQGS